MKEIVINGIKFYLVGSKLIFSESQAIKHQEKLEKPIDESLKHNFSQGDIVYYCFRERLRECVVDREEEDIILVQEKEEKEEKYVRRTYLVLKDLNDKSVNEIWINSQKELEDIKIDWRDLVTFRI